MEDVTTVRMEIRSPRGDKVHWKGENEKWQTVHALAKAMQFCTVWMKCDDHEWEQIGQVYNGAYENLETGGMQHVW